MARSQLDLFPRDLLEPASATPEQEALAADLPASLHMGTSSWTFPGWQGIVYARAVSKSKLAGHGLAAYARHPLLTGVGIDRSFYAPLSAETFAAYAEQVPLEFRFLVKAHEHCTWQRFPMQPRYGALAGQENERFLDTEYTTREVVNPLRRGLGANAGPLVFQFPPQGGVDPRVFAERLHDFLRGLPGGVHYAVEVRNRRWLTPEYAKALSETGATHCFTVHPTMPDVAEQRRMVDAAGADAGVVVRWMLGGNQKYEAALERYAPFDRIVDTDRDSRAAIAALCAEALDAGRPAFVTVNNKAEGSAPLSVFVLADAIRGARGHPETKPEEWSH
jgi:uncharacterized protein YecE (DUF72 family)